MERIKRDGQELVWINFRHLIKLMPLLKIKNIAAISNRLGKLHDLGLIHKYKKPASDKMKCNRVYCCISKKAASITEFRGIPILNKEGVPISNKDPLCSNKDNKNTNISKLKHKVSKDTYEAEASPLIKSSFSKKIIKDWNKRENTKKVSLTKRTKVIQNIEKYIKQLKEGTFLKNKVFNPDMLRINKIPSKMKKLTSKQIQQIINKMTLYLREGYPPTNKAIVGSLSEMLYSAHFQSSWFLQALYNPPKPIQVRVKDTNLKTTEYLIDQMKDNFEDSDKNKLIRGIKTIEEFVKNIPKESLEVYIIRSEAGSTFKICKEYIYWLGYQNWLEGANVSILNTNNKVWKRFIKSKEDDYPGYRLS